MDRTTPPVKAKRSYDSSARRERARQVRENIVDAAWKLFLNAGYAGTTINAIASDAGVSAETIYKVFGSKPGLVRAIRDKALAGRGPIGAEERSDEMRKRVADPRIVIRNWGTLTTEVAPLVAPILLLVREAAATDPELVILRREMEADRHARMTHNARFLHNRRFLRPGLTIKQAADVLWLYSSPELYEQLVLQCGWELDAYGRFVGDGIAASLLPRGFDVSPRTHHE